MYINKIDELIDKVIDDFANHLLEKNKVFKQIIRESNFVKYQLEINQLLKKYVDSINLDEVKDITDNAENTTKIVEILKRYLAYYIFLAVGFFYESRKETFINNVIEFTKNQPSFNYKIQNFFNSENNANIINYFDIVKNTALILELEPAKVAIAAKKPEFRETIKFLNTYGQEYVMANFKLENLGGDRKNQAHNIIKTVIFNELYFKQEKEDVFHILETAEKQEGTYIFINVVLPRNTQVDFSMVEKAMTEKELQRGYANEVYQFLQDSEKEPDMDISIDEKILILINHKILIPITEDFLLYHKDTEKYERIISGELNKSKKKEDTKIRYIVGKIDNVSEYYSDRVKKDTNMRKNIDKLFYMPLSNRKAMLVNEMEDINIITKLLNQGQRSTENNEYYNDLINYRHYPYINFKDFKTYGITINTNQTIDAVRSVSMEKENIKRKDRLQLRVGSDGHTLNVIGFMIPPNRSLECLKNSDLSSVRKLKKSDNGFKATLNILRESMFKKKQRGGRNIPYWIFHPDKDQVELDSYVQTSKMTINDSLKLVVSTMYNRVVEEIFAYVKKMLGGDNDTRPIPDCFQMMRNVEDKFFRIPRHTEFYRRIKQYIYFTKARKLELEYDEREDIFYGILGKVRKLPTIKNLEKKSAPGTAVIKIRQDFIDHDAKEEITEAEKVGAICQHFVSWDQIFSMRRSDPETFNKRLFEFIQQYVIENHEQEYVCKSCSTLVNIKKYIPDGQYDNESQRFVTFNMPMEVQLEDLPEYNKYRLTIRSIDKIIERIASIANITYYVGSSVSIKMRRKTVVKNVIDLISIHNKTMSKYYRQRNEKTESMYGINKSLTNLFVFELEDPIFIYSSKERDYYKHIKHNNVLVYIVLAMITELNRSQVVYMRGDRDCNYFWFNKIGHMLFDNLKIKVNNKDDTKPVLEYRVLCFLLYLMGCFISKFNIWYYDTGKEQEKLSKAKKHIMIQKVFVHTAIDILNSLLEVQGKQKDAHYQYQIFQTKFYSKLINLFNDNSLSKILKDTDDRKIATIGDKRRYVITKVKSIALTGEFAPMEYDKHKEYDNCTVRRWFIPPRNYVPTIFHHINNITTNPQGEFYNWVAKGKDMIDKNSGMKMKDVVVNQRDSDTANDNYYLYLMKKLAERYCPDGDVHNYVYSTQNKMNVCKKCSFKDANELSKEQLLKFRKIVEALHDKENQRIANRQERIQKKREQVEKAERDVISRMKADYGQSKEAGKNDYYQFIDKFIAGIRKIVGSDNTGMGEISLEHNSYLIDHDHQGNLLERPITISGKENKIIYKENHPFFKTDIIYYTNYKSGHVDVFYDAITHVLLGYKESHRDFVLNTRMKRYIIVKYSLRERLRLLGYPSKYINLQSRMKKTEKLFKSDKERQVRGIIADIGRDRIINLKRIMGNIVKSLYQIKYNFSGERSGASDDAPVDMLDQFRKKINKLRLKREDGTGKAYKHWKDITNGLYFYSLEKRTINVDVDAEYISSTDIARYDYHGNLILYYLVREMGHILEYNTNKFTRISIVQLLTTLINHYYEEYSEEELFHSLEMKRFHYRLQRQGFTYDVEQKGHGLEDQTDGFYGEHKDDDAKPTDDDIQEQEDFIESQQALDVDHDNADPDNYDAEEEGFGGDFESAVDSGTMG